jgi:dTDP-4-amino-4,6-dideoxygalactose transaminase
MSTSAGAVPFHRPTRVSGEGERMAAAVADGWLSGDGPVGQEVEALLAEQLEVPRVLLTPSGTAALELAALGLDLGPGDEVIVPSFAFPSTANAVTLRRARVVFAEVEEATLNLDVAHAASLVSERTRAVLPIHYGGIASQLDALEALAARHDLAVVEDAAHALFGAWRGRPLGSIGSFGAFSFHATKNVTCGEGGALAVADPALVERVEIMREKGTDRARFLRGEVDRYTWVDEGSSFLLAEPLAAMLLAQLQAAEAVQAARRARWLRYADALADWAEAIGARLPAMPEGAAPAWHSFWVLVPEVADRDPFMDHLRAAGIGSAFHFQPLHSSAMGRRLGGGAEPAELPVTDSVAARLVRLPFFTDLGEDEQDRAIEAVLAFRPG